MDQDGYYSYVRAAAHSLERNTAAVDWCEPNYIVSSYIAEFFNTISNVFFFLFPTILIRLFHVSYARPVGSSTCHLAFILLIIVGTSSTYYHATLSLFGQLLDEISILWVIILVAAIWTPLEYIPAMFGNQRRPYQVALFLAAVLITCLSWIVPVMNSILLMGWGIPITYIMTRETRRTQNARAYKLGVRCIIIWFLALGAWVTDRLHCNFWISVGFPYMHAMWHLLVALTSYQACVLLCYYSAASEWAHARQVSLRMWPSDDWMKLGVPYVFIESRLPATLV